MTGTRRGTAAAAGTLYLLTFVTSIPTLALYRPLRDHADFVRGAGSAVSVSGGALLEIALAVSCVGTAVVLFPVVRRQSPVAALGFLASRLLEGGLILAGVVSVLAMLTLRRDGSMGPSEAVAAGRTLLAVYDGTFLLGQSLMPVINAACLGYAMYRSGLVPRLIPLVGLAGAPLLLASDIAILLGAYPRDAALAGLAALPVAAWEFAFGAWLVVKGFRPAEELPVDVPRAPALIAH
jgi:uncharacterized protein DUF4386